MENATGEGFTILDDTDVCLATRKKTRLDMPMRRLRLKREDGLVLQVITNDLHRSAVEIAALYKARWEIELLFRWVKQHLKIASFLGRSENAVRLQILAAMIAYLLLRIAAKLSRSTLPALRFAELVGQCLFTRKTMARLDKPAPNPKKPQPKQMPGQLLLAYAWAITARLCLTSPDSPALLRGQAFADYVLAAPRLAQHLAHRIGYDRRQIFS